MTNEELRDQLAAAMPDWTDSTDGDEIAEVLAPVVHRLLNAERNRWFDAGNKHGREMAESRVTVMLQGLAGELDYAGKMASVHPELHSGPADGFVAAAEKIRNFLAKANR